MKYIIKFLTRNKYFVKVNIEMHGPIDRSYIMHILCIFVPEVEEYDLPATWHGPIAFSYLDRSIYNDL